MLNNTRHLHIALSHSTLTALSRLNLALLKRRYPGEHVALVRSEQSAFAQSLDFFHQIHVLDCTFIQRSAFSPLLGDATAFASFWQTLRPLTQERWSRVFNLGAKGHENAVSALFAAQSVGVRGRAQQLMCDESPVKLQVLLQAWGMHEPEIQNVLLRRALQQLDLSVLEETLTAASELRQGKGKSGVRGVVVGVLLKSGAQNEKRNLTFLQQLFSLVALDEVTAQELTALGIQHHDWSQHARERALWVDLTVQDFAGEECFWHHPLDISNKEPEDLTEKIAEMLPRNFAKWACLSFFFDYLGQQRMALLCEKMLMRYDRQVLQPFLYQEVLQLKDFAKLLLEGLRRQGSQQADVLGAYWQSHPSTLSFVSAIELSLHPSLKPLLRSDQDIIAVKNRLRTLNAFYERLHRALTLELPKTDLALTL